MKDNKHQFYLDIKYQQNSTWQGSLQRLDTGENINFRSALELLTLIEEASSQQIELDKSNERLRSWRKNSETNKITSESFKGTGTFGQ